MDDKVEMIALATFGRILRVPSLGDKVKNVKSSPGMLLVLWITQDHCTPSVCQHQLWENVNKRGDLSNPLDDNLKIHQHLKNKSLLIVRKNSTSEIRWESEASFVHFSSVSLKLLVADHVELRAMTNWVQLHVSLHSLFQWSQNILILLHVKSNQWSLGVCVPKNDTWLLFEGASTNASSNHVCQASVWCCMIHKKEMKAWLQHMHIIFLDNTGEKINKKKTEPWLAQQLASNGQCALHDVWQMQLCHLVEFLLQTMFVSFIVNAAVSKSIWSEIHNSVFQSCSTLKMRNSQSLMFCSSTARQWNFPHDLLLNQLWASVFSFCSEQWNTNAIFWWNLMLTDMPVQMSNIDFFQPSEEHSQPGTWTTHSTDSLAWESPFSGEVSTIFY